ncbi:MAG: rhomboid family intramembrane serine protease [Pseudomonadota bacterium]
MGLIDRSLAGRRVHPALWITAGLMVAAELLFAAVDVGLIGQDAGRGVGYALFGYWDIAFEHWRATGELHPQLIWSYLTHAFLHGGWLHLLMNAAALLGLGHAVSQLVGIRSFALIFLGTAVSGALVYSLITDFRGPLVGASGVVFGLIAVLTAWQEQALRRLGEDRTPIWHRILGLVVLNAVLDLAMGGMLAWEAHLGGFLAGWVLAQVIQPRRRPSPWQ